MKLHTGTLYSHIILLTIILVAYSTKANSQTLKNVTNEGPAKPSKSSHCRNDKIKCADYPLAVRITAPIGHILIVDAAMYFTMAGIWPTAFSPAQSNRSQFKKTWTSPPHWDRHGSLFELDGDPWPINAVMHGLYGSEAWLTARNFGHNPAIAFIYSAGAAFTWEYLIEGWFQQPSAIDLMWTPFAGAVIGELRYQLLKIANKKISIKGLKITVMTIIDPIGQLERLIFRCQFE